MTCPNCAVLRAKLDEATDELKAWQAYDADAQGDPAMDRLARWRAALGCGHGPVLVVMALVDAAGRIVAKTALIRATRASPAVNQASEDVSYNLVSVQLSKARVAIRRLAAAGRLPASFDTAEAGIKSHWGMGASIAPEHARALSVLAGDA